MSVSKWAYEPNICDGEPCCGECDLCWLADEAEAYRAELEEMEDPQQPSYRERNNFESWRNGMVRHPKGFINPRVLTGKW